jgi:bla regulator protein blaR1
MGPRFRLLPGPGGFTVTGATTKDLIRFAYDRGFNTLREFQILGGASWINSEKYYIDAKVDSLAEEIPKLPRDQGLEQIKLRVRSLLADRFKLRLSHETKELPVYALVIAKNGPKLQEAKPDQTYTPVPRGPDGRENPYMYWGKGQLIGEAIPIETLVLMLSEELNCTVLDRTGLKGIYNITLQWTPDQSQAEFLSKHKWPEDGKLGTGSVPPAESSRPSLFTAIQEQLGLKLESQKGEAVEVLVIDHVERPS